MDRRVVLDGALVALLAGGGTWAGVRGVRLLAGSISASDPEAPLRVIRGLRGLIVAFCAAAGICGLLLAQPWLLIFGALWFGEEMYETGVLALILRRGMRAVPTSGTGHRGASPGAVRRSG